MGEKEESSDRSQELRREGEKEGVEIRIGVQEDGQGRQVHEDGRKSYM